MQGNSSRVGLPLGRIEGRSPEALGVARIGQPVAHLRCRNAGKLPEELAASPAHGTVESGAVIGEIKERARGRELLTLKQHRNTGHH